MVLLREGAGQRGAVEGDAVDLVCGKRIVRTDGWALRREAETFERVLVDLGAGDGRFAYRLGRAHPAWFVLAVDANADGMREISHRAGRKPGRGGLSNIRFVRAAVERLPAALDGIADEITVLFPWGSLLQAVILPNPDVLRQIARLGKPGARFRLEVNASIFTDAAVRTRLGLPGTEDGDIERRLVPAYDQSGIRIEVWRRRAAYALTSWGRRLSHGGAAQVLEVDSVITRPGRGKTTCEETPG